MERRAEQLKEIERLHQEQRFEFTVNALGHDFFYRNREEEEERLRELEEDYEDDDFYSKKKKKKDNKKSSNEWTEDDYNLLVKLLNKYPGNCSFHKIIQNTLTKKHFILTK